MTMASISVRSVYDSKALTRMRSKDLISESVTDLAMQPYTMMALGCSAGLYWNENLKGNIKANVFNTTTDNIHKIEFKIGQMC